MLFATVLALVLVLLLSPRTALAESLCRDSQSNATSGSLTDSGGASGSYANNENCQFLIQPPSADDITLSFSAFNYESNFDFLSVYDGTSTSDTLLGTFSGTSAPADLTASSGAMLVVSTSDSSVIRSGFVASWRSTTTPVSASGSRLCVDSSATTETGTVTDSGGVSGSYSNNENCGFRIQPASGRPVVLSFTSFNYENSFDFVRVYDGTSVAGKLLGSFTGTSTPAELTAASGSMFIVSDTDGSVLASGFVANWSVIDGAFCAAESVGDLFNSVSYSGNTGSENWTTDWLEIGEADGPTTGISRVNSSLCTAGNCLRLGQPGSASSWSNRGVEREVNLLGSTTATLSFNYYTGYSRGAQSVALAVSEDGGSTWTTLRTYSISRSNFSANPESFDISAYASKNTRIRFLSSGSNATIGMYIDDLQIAYQPTCSPTAIAEWRFDEPRWTGVAGEVGDASGNLDGDAAGGVNTIAAGRVCRAVSFDGVDDEVVVSGIDTTLANTATLAFWLRTTQTGDSVPWRSPGLTGVELSGGTDDVFWGWLDSNGHVGVSAGDSSGARSATAVNDGNWHHVVLTRDHQSGEVQVYINGAREDSQISDTGSIGTSFQALGGVRNTGGNGNRLDAVVDELVMFNVVLSDAEIADIYSNQLAGNSWDGETRNCPVIEAAGLIIDHDQSGIHCLAEPVTVSAVDANNVVVSNYGNEITLDTQTGRGTWTLQSGGGTLTDITPDDGLATYQFASADAGQASFLLTYEQGSTPLDVEAYQSNSPTVRDDDSEGALNFAPSGFTLTASALANPPPMSISDPVGSQIAATNFSIHIAAFGTTDTDPECGVIETYQGNAPLEFWTDHDNPGSGTRTAIVNGAASANAESAASVQNTAFVNGQGQVTVRYKDAGSIRVHVKDETSYSHSLRGATNSFVVRPSALVVSRVESLSGNANPAAADMTGTGFVPSGQNFRVIVEARDADGDATPNFGLEAAPELVSVASNGLVAPIGGRHGSAGGVSGGDTLVRTGAGTFSSSTVLFDEVGIVRLTAAVRDGDYLGAGSVPGNPSGNVGRFYPASIALASGNVSTACSNYVYQDEPALQLSYTLRALNALGAVVENYDEDLLGATNVAAVLREAENADSGLSLAARLSNGSARWRSGELSELDVSAVFSRLAAPDGPFNNLQISLVLDDLRDGLVIDSANQNATTTGDCILAGNCDAAALGSAVQVRYGRLVVLPRSSSELADLDVPLVAQYFDGADFRRHDADNCSTYSVTNASLSDFQDDLSAGETNPIGPTAAASLIDGAADLSAPLLLRAPGAGNVGSVMLQLDAPDWLEYDWFGAGAADPSARQSFGSYRGHDRVVYWREVDE